MAPVTETAILSLKGGEHPDDANSPTGAKLRALIVTLLEQDGTQRCYWGREVENPDTLRFYVDWDSLEQHKKFIEGPEYKDFLDGWFTIIEGTPVLYHVDLTPHPPTKVLSNAHSPATEIVTVYFPADYSAELQAKFAADITKLSEVVGSSKGGSLASASGWVLEEVEFEGAQVRAFVLMLGWDSVAAHKAFQQTDAFRENIGLLRDAVGMKGRSVVHISGNEVSK